MNCNNARMDGSLDLTPRKAETLVAEALEDTRVVTRLGEPDGAAGQMIENFVMMELSRQLTWSAQRARLCHYRTKDQVEVDAVLEAPDGRIIAIEVKAGATIRAEDLAGLRHLAQRLGTRFIAGYVLYTGQQTLPFGDRLRAIPIDALWHSAPVTSHPRKVRPGGKLRETEMGDQEGL